MNLHAFRSSRYLFAIGSILLLPSAALCQDEKPQVDRTDPTAVVTAYLKACQDTDVKTAISLIVADDPIRQMMPEMASEMQRDVERQGMDVSLVMREFSFLPMPMFRFPEPAAPVLTEEAGVVFVKRTLPLDQKFVLRQDEDGLWLIDVVASMTATTGAEKSFLATQMQRGGGGAGPGASPYECMNHLRTLSQGLEDYAADNGGILPAADTWMDDLMPYVLDREVFKCPAAPDLECGYAFNIEVGGLALPTDWRERQEFVLLIEWGSGEPNSTAFPAETENMEPRHGEQILFATADRNTQFALKGETPEDVFTRKQITDTCSTRMRAISEAIRDYARDNAGFLPGPDTWCDDIMPYLMDQPAGEDVFACPAFPDAPFGYAYNKDLEGKNATELVRHRSIVVLMESDLGTRNASTSAAAVVASDRHGAQYVGQAPRGSHFGTLDGSVNFMPTGQPPRTQ